MERGRKVVVRPHHASEIEEYGSLEVSDEEEEEEEEEEDQSGRPGVGSASEHSGIGWDLLSSGGRWERFVTEAIF